MLQCLQCHITKFQKTQKTKKTKKLKKTKKQKTTQPTQDPLQSMSLFFFGFSTGFGHCTQENSFFVSICELWASVSVCLQSMHCTKTIDNLTQNKTSKPWQNPAKQKEQNCAPMNHPKTSDMGCAFLVFSRLKRKQKTKLQTPWTIPRLQTWGAQLFFSFFLVFSRFWRKKSAASDMGCAFVVFSRFWRKPKKQKHKTADPMNSSSLLTDSNRALSKTSRVQSYLFIGSLFRFELHNQVLIYVCQFL